MWKSAIQTVKKEQFFGIHYEDQFDLVLNGQLLEIRPAGFQANTQSDYVPT